MMMMICFSPLHTHPGDKPCSTHTRVLDGARRCGFWTTIFLCSSTRHSVQSTFVWLRCAHPLLYWSMCESCRSSVESEGRAEPLHGQGTRLSAPFPRHPARHGLPPSSPTAHVCGSERPESLRRSFSALFM